MSLYNKNILDRFKLDGKIALVTGAAQGIGKALAIALAQAGAAAVGLLDLESETLRHTEKELNAHFSSTQILALVAVRKDINHCVVYFGRDSFIKAHCCIDRTFPTLIKSIKLFHSLLPSLVGWILHVIMLESCLVEQKTSMLLKMLPWSSGKRH
jgi:enoyl-[acyl-carrier-protein] reductase (NADH)